MKDKVEGIIGVKQLRVKCIIGVHPHERFQEQELIIDLKVRSDFSMCRSEDDISCTVDYVSLSNRCTDVAIIGKFQLLETLAVRVLENIINTFNLPWAWIRVEKPGCIPGAFSSFVELEMEAASWVGR